MSTAYTEDETTWQYGDENTGDPGEFIPDDSTDDTTGGTYSSIFDAQDYALFIKKDQTKKSKDAEAKVKSVIKAGVLTSFKLNDPIDAATLLKYGSGFAKACGDLTDVSDGAQKAIDMLTVPDSPWIAFLAIGIPMTLQLLRNHEEAGTQVAQGFWAARKARKAAKKEGTQPPRKKLGHPVTINGPFGRKFTVHIPVPTPAIIGKILRAQTEDPYVMAKKVLTDEKLQKELRRQKITITFGPADE